MLHYKTGEIPDLDYKMATKKPIPIRVFQVNEPFEVESKEGLVKGKPGDYLMIGIEGELYICDEAIFNKSYILQHESNLTHSNIK